MSSSSLGIILLEKRGGTEGGEAAQHLAVEAPAAGRDRDRSYAVAQGRHCSQNRSAIILIYREVKSERWIKVESRKRRYLHGEVMCALRNMQHKKVLRCKESTVITSDYDCEGNVTRVMTHTTGQSHAAQPGLRTVFSIVSTQMMFSQWRTFSTRPPWPLSALSQIFG